MKNGKIKTKTNGTWENNMFKTRYDNTKTSTPVGTKSKTQQHFKNECDINTIMSKYMRTGTVPVTRLPPQYVDNNVTSYQEAMQLVMDANDRFDELPSQLRKRFQNDPAQFLEFVENPENAAEAVELGLCNYEMQSMPEAALRETDDIGEADKDVSPASEAR